MKYLCVIGVVIMIAGGGRTLFTQFGDFVNLLLEMQERPYLKLMELRCLNFVQSGSEYDCLIGAFCKSYI